MTQQEKKSVEGPPRLVVDTPPFLHTGYTVHGMARDTLLALLPAAAMAVFVYGLPALRVMALAAGTAVLAQALWERLLGRESRIHDGNAFIAGLLFAFLLPAAAPWWLVILGGVLTIILGREIFGGIGTNPLCPPLVAWAALTISWPAFMDPTAMNLHTDLVDPLLRLKYFGAAGLPQGGEMGLFLGQQNGGLGSSQIAAVLLGGLFLVARKTVRWEVPLAFIAGVLLTGGIFWRFGADMAISSSTPAPHLYLLTGGTLFAAFFLATEHASSPVTVPGLLLYGLLGGSLAVLIRIFGIYPDGAYFAVLLAALCTPLLDLIRVAPYGKRRA